MQHGNSQEDTNSSATSNDDVTKIQSQQERQQRALQFYRTKMNQSANAMRETETESVSTRSSKATSLKSSFQRIKSESIYSFASASYDSLVSLVDRTHAAPVTEYMTAHLKIQPNAQNTRLHQLQEELEKTGQAPRHNPKEKKISRETVEDIFVDLQKRFGFQADNVRNQFENLMVMIDSRISRMNENMAVMSLHADYIGGDNANYKKWYLVTFALPEYNADTNPEFYKLQKEDQLKVLDKAWRKSMKALSHFERIQQVALWLLIWGEAGNLRFMPELLCFVFKLANDYIYNPKSDKEMAVANSFLTTVVRPIYNFYRDQGYDVVKNQLIRKQKDHSDIIGYDDINENFRSMKTLESLLTFNNINVLSLHPTERYLYLPQIDLQRLVRKTYKEKRTPFHLITNFSRLWIIHLVVLYYFVASEATFFLEDENERHSGKHLSIVSLGSLIGIGITILQQLSELSFLPMTTFNISRCLWRLSLLTILACVNFGPSIYIFWFQNPPSAELGAAIAQLLISIFTTLTLILVPPAHLFSNTSIFMDDVEYANMPFVESFDPMDFKDRIMSVLVWGFVFAIKFVGGYFFLIKPFNGLLMAMYNYTTLCPSFADDKLCMTMGAIGLIVVLLLETTLFFLDTYLWYTVVITVGSVILNLKDGISIYSPWREVFYRLPKRMFSKLVAAEGADVPIRVLHACSELWNAIVISLFQDHQISSDSLSKMLYQVAIEEGHEPFVTEPRFFLAQEDSHSHHEFYPKDTDAQRRLGYFAHSLCMKIPEPVPVPTLPTFTVLVPHYGEKILYSLKEVLQVQDKTSRVTLLDYLKSLYPHEWENFVTDSKRIYKEERKQDEFVDESDSGDSEDEALTDKLFHSVGYHTADPKFILRTRVWASLKSQTLYRTVSGFMNYHTALKVLYRAENLDALTTGMKTDEELDADADLMATRKFNFVITMQRYQHFTKEDHESVDLLFSVFKDLQVAYLEEEANPDGTTLSKWYSCLIDGRCEVLENGRRKPKYRIQLPGFPILGDGKSDNQNHAIIFARGEVVQVIDANQDHYLEECLKIRNVLAEFEFKGDNAGNPYASKPTAHGPVAIVGTREHIFSEKVGGLADNAASKEFVFGTLIQRIMTRLGARLHYGHPDFLNTIFMTTRGGLSKAQKGLHLNEDIFAGMTAFQRGGRIKHTEYIQCGKGRDLGFMSIASFVSKLGFGVGEQTLSRESWRIGTRLSTDRFLSYYFAHTGFYFNAIFIINSIRLFMTLCIIAFIMSAHNSRVCDVNALNCTNLSLVHEYISACVITVSTAIAASFLPLFFQMLTEVGLWKAVSRVVLILVSLVSIFESFVVRIYALSFLNDISFGGATYVSTGRSVSTSRIPFHQLYHRYSKLGISLGFKFMLMSLFLSTFGFNVYLTFFWFTAGSLAFAPFIFNPAQFVLKDFLIDYKETLKWLLGGHDQWVPDTWVAMVQRERAKMVGQVGLFLRARLRVFLVENIGFDACIAVLFIIVYAYHEVSLSQLQSVRRIFAFALLPIAFNVGVAIIGFALALTLGIITRRRSHTVVVASICHMCGVVSLIGTTWIYWLWTNDFKSMLLLFIPMSSIQSIVFNGIHFIMTPEDRVGNTHTAFWSGHWIDAKLGWKLAFSWLREILVKSVEITQFGNDFMMVHLLYWFMFPLCFVPYINKAHTLMLLWVRPSEVGRRAKTMRATEQNKRKKQAANAAAIFIGIMVIFLFLIFIRYMAPNLHPSVSRWLSRLERTGLPF